LNSDPVVPDTAASTLERPIPGAPSSLLTFAPWRGPGVSMKALAQRWQDRERKQQEQRRRLLWGLRCRDTTATVAHDLHTMLLAFLHRHIKSSIEESTLRAKLCWASETKIGTGFWA